MGKALFHYNCTIVFGVWLQTFKEDVLVNDFLSLSLSLSFSVCHCLSLSVSVFVSTELNGMVVCE